MSSLGGIRQDLISGAQVVIDDDEFLALEKVSECVRVNVLKSPVTGRRIVALVANI